MTQNYTCYWLQRSIANVFEKLKATNMFLDQKNCFAICIQTSMSVLITEFKIDGQRRFKIVNVLLSIKANETNLKFMTAKIKPVAEEMFLCWCQRLSSSQNYGFYCYVSFC